MKYICRQCGELYKCSCDSLANYFIPPLEVPDNYKHIPGRVILVDSFDNVILTDNGDGTCSGIDPKFLNAI